MEQRVFLAQESFRVFVSALSYVGEIKQLPNSLNSSLPVGSYLYALTFLDQEVSFECLGYTVEQKSLIHHEFRANNVDISEANTIFLNFATEKELDCSEIKLANIGTLIDPQKAATIVINVTDIIGEKTYQLSGPGIKDRLVIKLPRELQKLMLIREELNKEYPLGVDMIISDSSGQLMALPRTTVVMEVN